MAKWSQLAKGFSPPPPPLLLPPPPLLLSPRASVSGLILLAVFLGLCVSSAAGWGGGGVNSFSVDRRNPLHM